MSSLARFFAACAAGAALGLTATAAAHHPGHYGIGEVPTAEQIAAWDIDIRPDGAGLPPGSGTVQEGEEIYDRQCASCHGVFGMGEGRYPPLAGGTVDDLRRAGQLGLRPDKTVGSYWPHATTLFDYIRRAMPFGNGQSLTAGQTYAVTAYVLHLNGILPYEGALDADSLAAVEMPNRGGFFDDPRPDVVNTACMRDCRDGLQVVSRAEELDVTPESDDEALR